MGGGLSFAITVFSINVYYRISWTVNSLFSLFGSHILVVNVYINISRPTDILLLFYTLCFNIRCALIVIHLVRSLRLDSVREDISSNGKFYIK